MRLSFQSIDARCRIENPLVSPYVSEKTIRNGTSFGVSGNGYDIRIKESLTLYPRTLKYLLWNAISRGIMAKIGLQKLMPLKLAYSLAVSVEEFNVPADLSFDLKDKSTYARKFVSVFNTMSDAGFYGGLTLEIVNHSDDVIKIQAGDPIGQVIFEMLDEPTERPYKGKYQGQPNEPVPAIMEQA